MGPASSLDRSAMSDINMTPLIDVLLVLLVMFIITIPIQTHSVRIDLPGDCSDCPVVDKVRNSIAISPSGATSWNGVTVSVAQLDHNLRESVRMKPVPELHFIPDPEAPYERVDQILAMSKKSGVTSMGFVGNERFQHF